MLDAYDFEPLRTIVDVGGGNGLALAAMLVVGGSERTEQQYAGIFSAAGLRMSRVVPTAHEVSVIEGVCPI